VEAGLISPVVLIIVSIAGVCGFVLPNRDLAEGIRIWRFGTAIAAGFLGIWGVAVCMALLILHMALLRCLGVSFLTIGAGAGGILRPRLKEQTSRDPKLHPEDKRNQK